MGKWESFQLLVNQSTGFVGGLGNLEDSWILGDLGLGRWVLEEKRFGGKTMVKT